MYVINENLRDRIYDGGLQYTPIIQIGETVIDNSNIKSFEISDPLIDTEKKFLYLGTFISKQLTLEFRNIQNIDFNEQISVSYQISYPNITPQTVPIGIFNIDTSPKDYYEKAKITAYDNGIKFKNRVETISTIVGNGITAENLLIALCQYFGVTLDTYPDINRDKVTGFIDNTISGKQYISYIAEIMGGFVKINRDGSLKIAPMKSAPVVNINALASKSFKLGEKYKVVGVFYDNGKFEHHSPQNNWEQLDGNKLALRQDNIFITGSEQNRQNAIDNVYSSIQDLEVYSIEIENYIDIGLDAYDIVSYSLDEENYLTYYNYKYTYRGGSPIGQVNTQIPTQAIEETTNTLQADKTIEEEVRSIRTTVNQQEATMETIATRTTTLENSGFVNMQQVREELAPDRLAISVTNQTIEDGVPKVDAEGFTFDNTGLNLARKDEAGNYIGDVRSQMNEKAFQVIDNSNNNAVLYVGYDDDLKQTTVIAHNTTIKNYLNIDNAGHWQKYKYVDETYRTNIDNTTRIGFFWTMYEEEDN